MRLSIRTVLIRLIITAVLPFSFAATAQSRESSFYLRLPLPSGVSVELPRNWTAISGHSRLTLEAAVEAMTRGRDVPESTLPFAANLYDDRKVVIAIFNVRYYPGMDVSQSEAEQLNQADLEVIDASIRAEMTSAMAGSGLDILSWNGTSKRRVGGKVALITDYRRSGLRGSSPFRVRLVRFLDNRSSFTATVSYKESMSVLLKPMTDYIIESIHILD